ncbi:MAG: hypothetical protein AAF085_14835 [Planctomycetota bacterium]
MPNKAQLTEQAQGLGISVTPDMTKAQITEAIKAKQNDETKEPNQADEPLSFNGKKLVEFDRHIVGPPRRSKGQRVWLTPALAKRQGLKRGDCHIVTR